MAKNKVSEWSSTASNNTDVGGIDIAEGCAPSGINNGIRELMAQIKDMQSGADSDTFTVNGNLTVGSTLTANSSVGTAGQALLSQGAGLPPTWGAAFVSGMIMMWAGSSASIPSGWYLCNGANGTPNLVDRFVVGAGNSYAVGATGGSADAIVVNHTHTATSTVTDPGHFHQAVRPWGTNSVGVGSYTGNYGGIQGTTDATSNSTTGITVATTNQSTGTSGTGANLPPYYALCYIMKA